LKTVLAVLALIFFSSLAGCGTSGGGKTLLTVDFRSGETLRYRFVTDRQTEVDWGPVKGASQSSQNKGHKIDKFADLMDMVVSYTPVEVDPYGSTTIKATCESIKIKRGQAKGRADSARDPVETIAGKSFNFTVGPTGKIQDYSQMESLIQQAGEKAFRTSTKDGRIKDPDMTDDFICTQWFLWDAVSSIEQPLKGLNISDSWNSMLSVPTQMVLRKARTVTYTLDEIRQTDQGRIAVISSSYGPAESVPATWPVAYKGPGFMVSGTFGFLQGYKTAELKGSGEELFNIDLGRTEKYNQQYEMRLRCHLPMGLGGVIPITVRQKITMQLLPQDNKSQ